MGKPAVGARDLVVGLVPTPEAADLGDLDPGWVAEHARQAARMLPGGLRVLGVYAFCDAAAFKASAALLASALREVRPGGGCDDRASGGRLTRPRGHRRSRRRCRTSSRRPGSRRPTAWWPCTSTPPSAASWPPGGAPRPGPSTAR